MFGKLKLKLAHFIMHRKYLKKNLQPIVFNKAISDAVDFLILMPEDDKDFYYCQEVIKYLLIHRKQIVLFAPEPKINLVPDKEKYKFISFSALQRTKLNLPDPLLVQKLKNETFDVVMDLNRTENIFYSAAANIVDSKLRVSFSKPGSEGYYNFQFANTKEEPEVTYRNLLNFLQMF